jgi:hypothetical protein
MGFGGFFVLKIVVLFLMPNPFVISILILITTLATTPTIANTKWFCF